MCLDLEKQSTWRVSIKATKTMYNDDFSNLELHAFEISKMYILFFRLVQGASYACSRTSVRRRLTNLQFREYPIVALECFCVLLMQISHVRH